DIDPKKIDLLNEGKSPIYEPGLNDLLERNIRSNRLHFSTGYDSCVKADTIFLAVGTPSGDDGNADLKYLESAAKSVAETLSDHAVIVIKSTVPVGTGEKIRKLIEGLTDKKFYLVNNPEFLKEGTAIEDFMRPDRVIIGSKEEFAARQMDELYRPLLRQGNPIHHMSNLSAEMTKYTANCFLAAKISFINEIANLCDKTGADIEEVRKGISSDVRIGKHFLYPGPGYGGSCFPKDVKALIYTAKEYQTELKIVQAAEDINYSQKTVMFEKIKDHFKGDLTGKKFAFWGVAFKANTDDVRETSAINMAKALIDAGAEVCFYDPVASENYLDAMKAYPQSEGKLHNIHDMYEVMKDCDGLVTMTEWREFRNPDYEKLKALLRNHVVFDARNLFDTKRTLEAGLAYYAIGKHIEES
ncbi:MAG: UDP-glucose/GDP-mannose dehydrogenase family protein, partial [Halobacteriovoraceae bacterium]|nr:UDP-glucose/GDP-mannose dehydrogenase family protein [Halobacteriovoraceae bacterium]